MPTINQLNAVSSPSASDLLALYSQSNGDARKISLANLATFLQTLITVSDDKITQYAAPLAGATVQVEDGSDSVWLILTPAGLLATLTVKLPALANCVDHQEVLVNCTQIVTALTIDANGASVVGGPTAFAANGFFRLRFDAVLHTWYRVG